MLTFSERKFLNIYRKMSHYVFVYGTLKRNEPNHHWLTETKNGTGTFVGEAKTANKYPLIIGTKYNIPFLLFKPGVGHNVSGEVYEVDDKMLSNLDILEDHPNYYIREKDVVQLYSTDSKLCKELSCWMYFIKNFKQHLLQNPHIEDYRSDGPHGLPYLESNNESTLDDLDDIINITNDNKGN